MKSTSENKSRTLIKWDQKQQIASLSLIYAKSNLTSVRQWWAMSNDLCHATANSHSSNYPLKTTMLWWIWSTIILSRPWMSGLKRMIRSRRSGPSKVRSIGSLDWSSSIEEKIETCPSCNHRSRLRQMRVTWWAISKPPGFCFATRLRKRSYFL